MQAQKSTRRDRKRKGGIPKVYQGKDAGCKRETMVGHRVYGGEAGTKMNKRGACLCLVVELRRVGMCIDAGRGRENI